MPTIRFANGTWQSFWDNIQAHIPQGPDIRPVAQVNCAFDPYRNRLHICVVNRAGGLYHTIGDFDAQTWQPFWGDIQSQIPQGPEIRPVKQVACAFHANQNRLHVCAINRAGVLYHTIGDFNAQTWQPFWGNVQAQMPTIPLPGPLRGVACAVNQQGGELHVCVLAPDELLQHSLHHTIRFFDGTWQSFFDQRLLLDGRGQAFGQVACATNQQGDLHVCAVTDVEGLDTDGQLWYTLYQAVNKTWLDFDNVLEDLNVLGAVLQVSVSHN